MQGKNKKSGQQKNITEAYLNGSLDQDRMETGHKYSSKNKHMQGNKTAKTALARANEVQRGIDTDALPLGEVMQVFSLYSEVHHGGQVYLCVVRKTLNQVNDTGLIVGDRVRVTLIEPKDASGNKEGVIERIEPRDTVLTRADSFKQITQHPIVANAEQMLIVMALHQPDIKWGLIDRMVIAAQAGGLVPILCLNKIDTAKDGSDLEQARENLSHYASLGIKTLETSAETKVGIEDLRGILQNRVTVLAGHSGVGKSTLVRAIQPTLNIRTAPVSNYNDKGRHTTTSARTYPLDPTNKSAGALIDTPGVKLFGLWNVTRENLPEFFPDLETLPQWRRESYERILESIG